MAFTKARNHTPTEHELIQAIARCLKENKTTDPKVVRSNLLQDHYTWRVPERRVRKFVKRQVKADATTDTTMEENNDDVSIASSTQRVQNMVKKIFSRRGSNKNDTIQEEAPIASIQIESILPELPDNQSDDEVNLVQASESKPQSIPAEVMEEFLEKEISITTADDAIIYKDDNDGKRSGCACDGCIIT